MKKKFEWVKTLQLTAVIVLAAVGLIVVLKDEALYQMVGRNGSVRGLCVLLWLSLGLSFAGIFWDFSNHSAFKKDYRELDYAVYHDPIAGIANRYTCDAMIEKYMDQPLPPTVGCVMLDLVNIRDINEKYGHDRGNETIQEFSGILHAASIGLCFVGRNGGNKFMALFESAGESQIDAFLTRVHRQAASYNDHGNGLTIEYRSGRALSRDERVTGITQLIALADRRLTLQTDRVAGIASRASCDDIIGLYLDKPLPENIGCVMLDIANIRNINEKWGHLAGNQVIRQFGDGLREAAAGLCFVGRNGGSQFLALFEDCNNEKIDQFLKNVESRVTAYNNQESAQIRYRFGRAFQEGEKVSTIDQLVALSARRMNGSGE